MIDFSDIQRDIEAIIAHSQEYAFDINCIETIKDWEKNKKSFIELFGNELRIKSKDKIRITLTQDERSKKFSDFLGGLKDNIIVSKEFEEFLQENQDGFFDNMVVKGSPQHGITANSKLLKSFKKFLVDPSLIRYAQDFASQYIQEAKVEGYLYLSIDPRDFLTISENNANWRSCHALDGDYRTGNLSYMCDKTTIIAYLADDKDAHYSCLPEGMVWNSKKWRMLVHIGENIVYFNKQYPFSSDQLLITTLSMINELFVPIKCFDLQPDTFGFRYFNNGNGSQISLEHNTLLFFHRPFDMADIINYKDYQGYCDLIYAGNYFPRFAINIRETDLWEMRYEKDDSLLDEYVKIKNIFGLKIGEKCKCLVCNCNDIQRTDKFLCDTCIAELDMDEDMFLKCSECGRHLYPTDEAYFIGDEPVCASCYKSIEEEDHITIEEGD